MKRSGKPYETGMLSDLPRHAEAEVALHLFDRRGDPSFEEGILTSLQTTRPKTRRHRVCYLGNPLPAGGADQVPQTNFGQFCLS